MKPSLILLYIALSVSAYAQEWTNIYNGKNLENWEHVGGGSFVIEDGLLKTEGGMGLLWYTPNKMHDVKLRVVYKGADKNNAGVFIRIPEIPTEAWMPVNKGYEVQIDDRGDDYHKTGVLYSLTEAKASPGKPGEWNVMEITLDGERTMVEVNGVLVTDYKEGDDVPDKVNSYEPDRGRRPVAGYIGFQNHGNRDIIYFKEVSYMDLK